MFDMWFPKHWSTLRKLIWLKASALASAVYQTVTGAIATFTTLRSAPLKSLVVDIEPVQSGTGDPSPDNVRPISGWSEAKVWVEATHDTSADPTVTIDLDGTRYGGTLDVLTGVLTVDSRYFVADGVNIKTSIGYGAGGPKWLPAISLSTADYADTNHPSTEMLASYLVGSANVSGQENTFGWGNSGHVIMLHIGTMQGTDGTHGYNSAAEVHAAVNAYLAEHNLGIWYKLATPITYQLTPTEVTALLGENNVWSDAGDVTVEYRSN